jgi:Putative  PD-(D/E)XK family member, (DUF4420)
VLVETAPAPSIPPPVRLENLFVEHGVKCKIWHDAQLVEEGLFTVIRCVAPNSVLRHQFFALTTPFLFALGTDPTPSRVAMVIDALVELFRALTKPPRKSVQGLWAELYFIARARDCKALVGAWHASPDERYDFAIGNHRIEVKSSARRERRHHFSLEQLSPPVRTIVLIASVCAEPSGGGTSLRDLLNKIRSRLSGDSLLLLHLESVVGATLGRSLLEAMGEAYDVQMADQSLRFFEVAAVPRPGGPIPFEVSDVRFLVDLTHVRTVQLADFGGTGVLFEAALSA